MVLMIVTIAGMRKKEYKVISYLGKHSMNMYLVHSFILGYFYSDFIYGLNQPVLMFVIILFSSLAISIALEWFKKAICLQKIQNKLLNFAN